MGDRFNVIVTTCSAATGRILASSVIDYNSRGDRQWLARHSQWALQNGRSVTTEPEYVYPDAMIAARKTSPGAA